MAQAEGTSKNDGRVGSSVSGASGSRSTSSSTSSSKSEKDDGRPTSKGISEGKSSGFGSSGNSGGRTGRSGAANSNPSSKTGSSKSSSGYSSFGQSTAGAIGKALGGLLGGGIGGFVGGSIGKSLDSVFNDGVKGPQDATDRVTGKTVKESQDAVSARSKTGTRDFSGLGGNYGTIANTLANAGWTNSMIAGYLGSIQQESGANPRARNKGDASDGTDSVGQGQWNMDRLANLERYTGGNIYDTQKQTEFTMHELATTHKNVADKLAKAEDDPAAYAKVFGANYEVSKQIPERQNYARGWANKISQLGIPDVEKSFKKVDDFVASIQNVNKPIGEKPSSQNTDPFGIGTFLSDTLGISNPNTGKQKDGTYVDPMVSSVEGRRRRGESNDPTPTKGRSGVAGIVEKGQQGKPLGVAAGITKAVTDPFGFAVETIMDLGNQTTAMNTPGPEGEGGDYSQREFGLGFLSSFLNGSGNGSSGVFAPSEKNSNPGSSPAADTQKVAHTPVSQPVDVPVVAQTLTPFTQATTPDVSVSPVRKPFYWSTITGTLDNILGTSYNG